MRHKQRSGLPDLMSYGINLICCVRKADGFQMLYYHTILFRKLQVFFKKKFHYFRKKFRFGRISQQ